MQECCIRAYGYSIRTSFVLNDTDIPVIYNSLLFTGNVCYYLKKYTIYGLQERIQNFKLGGAHLKKLRRAEGGAKIFGVFRVKNHDFTPKNLIFSNCGGRLENCWGISCEKSRFYAKKSYFFQFYGGGGACRVRPTPWIRFWLKCQTCRSSAHVHTGAVFVRALSPMIPIYQLYITAYLQVKRGTT